jgi:type IV pilus assembly protein PilA
MATLRKRHKPNGFTIAELFVVVIIIGILAMIALPSFVCAHKDPEGKAYVGTLIRHQQAYFIENGRFAESIKQLGSPVPIETTHYSYSVEKHDTKAFAYAKTQKSALKSYVGGAFLRKEGKELITQGIVCVAQHAGTQPIAPPIDAQTCGEGTIKPPRTKNRC